MTAEAAQTLRREGLYRLSPKERDCLLLVMRNYSSKEIARQLGISQTSVDTYVRRAREKLGLRDRFQAARVFDAWRRRAPAADVGLAARQPAGVGLKALRLRPMASLTIRQRLTAVGCGAVAGSALFGVLLTALAAL